MGSSTLPKKNTTVAEEDRRTLQDRRVSDDRRQGRDPNYQGLIRRMTVDRREKTTSRRQPSNPDEKLK